MKKPKPPTAGEREVMKFTGWKKYIVRSSANAKREAASIDRAIDRAVRKERERCIACLQVDGLAIPLPLLDGSKP